ncbi:MAG: hypothetical protein IT348_13610 [Candidatus Eisenbacteria bacterium]|nr:hypothetical protein [Candidatus Eisenbacteria bacterium]
MRKISALSMVALLALTLAIAAMGCAQKAEEAPAATETPAATDTMMTEGAPADTAAMVDTMATH